jgi:type I restriction enzyme S subunit
MSKQWPLVKLGDVLSATSREETVDASKTYRLLGIRLEGKGPFLRESVSGTQTSATKLFRVAQGDFIYSRLFAWRGAFGVIDASLDGCYVSSEFPAFTPDPQMLDAEYLKYWFRLGPVIKRVEADCTGSTPLTRNRFKENFFFALEIPLPPLAEQRRLVARIEALAGLIAEAQALRKEIVQDAENILLTSYKSLVKDTPCIPLDSLAPLTRRPLAVDIEATYPQISARSFGRGTFHQPPIPGALITWQKPFLVKAGDVLISNIKAWEGAIAVVSPEDDGRVCSHRYLTCAPIKGKASPHFVAYHLLTEEGLYHIGEASPGSADRNRTLSSTALRQIPIPQLSYAKQVWFENLIEQVEGLKQLQAETQAELDALLPAVLEGVFKQNQAKAYPELDVELGMAAEP